MSNPKRTRKEIRQAIIKTKDMKEHKNELSNIEDVDKVIIEILEEEEIDYTCCNVEITEDIKDIGLCPICLEHI